MALTSLQKLLQRNRSVKRFVTQLEINLRDFSDPAALALSKQIAQDRANLETLNTALEVRKALDTAFSGQATYTSAMQTFDMVAAELQAPSSRGGGGSRAAIAGGVAVFFLVAALIGVMFFVFGNQRTLELLGQVPVARGLITFTVTIGTIGVALAMIGAAFISQAEDLKDRLSVGNQVLTALIAVLGTIVGFYYGTSDGDPTDTPVELGLSSQRVSPTILTPGDTLTLAATIEGGTVPYVVTARLQEVDGGDVVSEHMMQVAGALALISFDVPEELSAEMELALDITDSDGTEMETATIELELGPTEAVDEPQADEEPEVEEPQPDTPADAEEPVDEEADPAVTVPN